MGSRRALAALARAAIAVSMLMPAINRAHADGPATAPGDSAAGGAVAGSAFINADPYHDSAASGDEAGSDGAVLPAAGVHLPLVQPDWNDTSVPGWQLLPDGLIYPTYLAGMKEPRLAAHIIHEEHAGWLFDATIGARVGIVRWTSPIDPTIWQLDIETAAFPRLNLDRNWDLVSTDFHFGLPLTYRWNNLQWKFGYSHLSAHLGDEEAINGSVTLAERINYSRDALLTGLSYYVRPDLRLYAEAEWAFYADGGADPWHFQFGTEYSSQQPTGPDGAPFVAVHGSLREELDFGGNVVVQAGWQWRGLSGRLLRVGLHYYNGYSSQYQFFRRHEEQIGLGFWYDF